MLVVNGAQSGNVFWRVNGAVAPTAGSTTVGTVMANGAFSLGEGATVNGRVLVTAAGTFSGNSITTTSPMTNPVAPTGVAGTVANTELVVSWTLPASTGGSADWAGS